MGKIRETLKVKEVFGTIIGGIILSAITFYLVFTYGDFNIINKNYGTYATLAATFIGFLITAFTILFALPEEGKIKNLKDHRLYPHLFYTFIISIASQVLVLILSLIGILFNFIGIVYTFIVLTSMETSLILLCLVVWILKKLLDLYFKK